MAGSGTGCFGDFFVEAGLAAEPEGEFAAALAAEGAPELEEGAAFGTAAFDSEEGLLFLRLRSVIQISHTK
jgi:hypothetical protein